MKDLKLRNQLTARSQPRSFQELYRKSSWWSRKRKSQGTQESTANCSGRCTGRGRAMLISRTCLPLLRGGCLLHAQDPESLTKRLDLLLPFRNALVVSDARVDAARLELVVVGERGVELPLGGEAVLIRVVEVRLLRDLGLLLVVKVRFLDGLVLGALGHEAAVFLRRGVLRGTCLRLKLGEVALDYLEHADDSGGLTAHTRVRSVEGLRRVVFRAFAFALALHER